MMIPKIIHRIWFGEKNIPESYENYWCAWQRQYPDYHFKTWRDSDIKPDFLTYEKINQAQGMARKADIARYEILNKEGGIYLDCDMMPYHHLDWQKLNSDFVVCNETESNDYCSIGIIASTADHPILQKAIHELTRKPINVLPPNQETGPFYFKSILNSGSFHQLDKNSFYPYLGNEPYSFTFVRNLNQTYGIHIWAGSWFDEKQVIEKINGLIHYGDLIELANLSQRVNVQLQKDILNYSHLMNNVRQSLINFASHNIFANSYNLNAVYECEFLKCAFYLLQQNKNALIWQIGAADGIIADPIRPLMINFDPNAILLEPNPYLFEKLKNNYKKNTHATFLNVALTKENGSLILNAINPEKVDNSDVPDWTIGISSFYDNRNALGGLTIDKITTEKIQKCVDKIKVETIDVKSLLAKTDNKRPDIVVIDVEGMDADVVNFILDEGIKPKIIQFEIQCLPQVEITAITQRLMNDYVQFNYGNDRVAYHKDFFKEYCDYIYINFGIPTFYKDIFKMVVN